MNKIINLELMHDVKAGGGSQGPIVPGGSGGPDPGTVIHVLLSVVEAGPLHVHSLKDLRFSLPADANPNAARIGIYLPPGMSGEILFLDCIKLQPVAGSLFAIDSATASAADVHLLAGNTIGVEVRAQTGHIAVTAETPSMSYGGSK